MPIKTIDKATRRSRIRAALIAGLASTALAGVVATAHAAPSHRASTQLSLVAYSTPREAFSELIPAFQHTPAGQGVSFTQSYGPSGSQSQAVANGLPADVVQLSLAPDVDSLVASRLVSKSWAAGPTRGIVTDSVILFVVRKGNPKHIHTWADLIKPGVQVITPNPFTSGGARWNVMAAYGAQLASHRSPAQAIGYLGKLFHHVSVQDSSARNALNTFLTGKGDVLIYYESDALQALESHAPIDLVWPSKTILVQNPVAVTTSTSHPTEAKAFVQFLLSPQAQAIWAKHGYRPVLPSVFKQYRREFPQPKGLFTINQLGIGGWKVAQPKFFDPTSGVMAKIERGL